MHLCALTTSPAMRLLIGVFSTELQSISPNAACQSPKFPAANISVRPAIANWIFHGFVVAHLAARLSKSPVRQFETYCQIRCVIQPSSLNALGATCKRISLPDIRDMSALGVKRFTQAHYIKLTFTYFTYLYTHIGLRSIRPGSIRPIYRSIRPT